MKNFKLLLAHKWTQLCMASVNDYIGSYGNVFIGFTMLKCGV